MRVVALFHGARSALAGCHSSRCSKAFDIRLAEVFFAPNPRY